MLIQISLIVLSTLMTAVGAVLLWMLRDRLDMAKTEGAVSARLIEHDNRLGSLEKQVGGSVSRREHEDLQKIVADGLVDTRGELRAMRLDISRMMSILARAEGVGKIK
jgi:hypothetical protein